MQKKILGLITLLGMIFTIVFSTTGNQVEAASYTSVDVSIYSIDNVNNKAIIKIVGEPGATIQFVVRDVNNNNKAVVHTEFVMPKGGVFYYEKSFSESYYRAYVYQYSPYSSSDEAYFWIK